MQNTDAAPHCYYCYLDGFDTVADARAQVAARTGGAHPTSARLRKSAREIDIKILRMPCQSCRSRRYVPSPSRYCSCTGGGPVVQPLHTLVQCTWQLVCHANGQLVCRATEQWSSTISAIILQISDARLTSASKIYVRRQRLGGTLNASRTIMAYG